MLVERYFCSSCMNKMKSHSISVFILVYPLGPFSLKVLISGGEISSCSCFHYIFGLSVPCYVSHVIICVCVSVCIIAFPPHIQIWFVSRHVGLDMVKHMFTPGVNACKTCWEQVSERSKSIQCEHVSVKTESKPHLAPNLRTASKHLQTPSTSPSMSGSAAEIHRRLKLGLILPNNKSADWDHKALSSSPLHTV